MDLHIGYTLEQDNYCWNQVAYNLILKCPFYIDKEVNCFIFHHLFHQ